MVSCEKFGTFSDGREIHIYRIENAKGEKAEFLDYGASIHGISVFDRDGSLGDVVLGAPDAKTLETSGFIGITIGRCANRISHGRYEADGKTVQLEQNRGGHYIHGASGNYAKKVFKGTLLPEENAVSFTLTDTGEGGFDCSVEVEVRYQFDDDSRLTMTYNMVPDGTTPIAPTNHSYFSLSGGDVRGDILKLNARFIASRDEDGIPDGGRVSVAGTSTDFTKPRSIGDAMANDPTDYFKGKAPGYDEFFILDKRPGTPAAELRSPATGRVMRIYTEFPSIVMFCIGDRRSAMGKQGVPYTGYCFVCLEPGFVPNAVNCPEYDSPVYRKGERLLAKSVYEFSAE